MYYVYLLKINHPTQEYYIGSTPDLKRRLKEHQAGDSFFTKSRLPVELIYYESYGNSDLALEREKKLKYFGSSYTGLMKRLKLI